MPTLAPGETYETDDGRAISIDDLAVHPSVVTVVYVSSTHYYERVTNARNGQYLTFQVEVDGFDLETEESELYDKPIDVPMVVDIDGERYSDPIPVGRDDYPYRDRVAIEVPVVNADEAGVVWSRKDGPAARWSLGRGTVEKLAAAPAFEVRSWSVPDRVQYGDPFETTVTVANVGDRDGRFLAEFGANQGSSDVPEVSWRVPAGAERSVTEFINPHYYEGVESIPVVLDWGTESKRRTVQVTRDGTETDIANG